MDNKTLIQHILSWIDTPWKVIAAAVIVVIGTMAYVVIDNSSAIVSGLKSSVATIDVTPEQLKKAIDHTQSDAVIVWSLDLESNTRRIVLSDPPLPQYYERDTLLLDGTDSAYNVVAALTENRVMCGSIESISYPSNPPLEITYRCVAGVPPKFGALVGYVSVSYKQPPPDASLPMIRQQLLIFSQEITK